MITVKNNVFHLATRSLSLVFMIDGAGLAEQLHFGRRLAHPEDDVEALRVKRLSPRPGEVSYSARRMTVCETDLPLEFSAPGRGDMRTPFIIVDPSGDGDEELDLVYQDCETYLGVKRCDSGLVQAIAGEEEAQGIRLDFTDSRRGLTLSLYYTVFPSLDVFVRRTVLTNTKGRRPLGTGEPHHTPQSRGRLPRQRIAQRHHWMHISRHLPREGGGMHSHRPPLPRRPLRERRGHPLWQDPHPRRRERRDDARGPRGR